MNRFSLGLIAASNIGLLLGVATIYARREKLSYINALFLTLIMQLFGICLVAAGHFFTAAYHAFIFLGTSLYDAVYFAEGIINTVSSRPLILDLAMVGYVPGSLTAFALVAIGFGPRGLLTGSSVSLAAITIQDFLAPWSHLTGSWSVAVPLIFENLVGSLLLVWILRIINRFIVTYQYRISMLRPFLKGPTGWSALATLISLIGVSAWLFLPRATSFKLEIEDWSSLFLESPSLMISGDRFVEAGGAIPCSVEDSMVVGQLVDNLEILLVDEHLRRVKLPGMVRVAAARSWSVGDGVEEEIPPAAPRLETLINQKDSFNNISFESSMSIRPTTKNILLIHGNGGEMKLGLPHGKIQLSREVGNLADIFPLKMEQRDCELRSWPAAEVIVTDNPGSSMHVLIDTSVAWNGNNFLWRITERTMSKPMTFPSSILFPEVGGSSRDWEMVADGEFMLSVDEEQWDLRGPSSTPVFLVEATTDQAVAGVLAKGLGYLETFNCEKILACIAEMGFGRMKVRDARGRVRIGAGETLAVGPNGDFDVSNSLFLFRVRQEDKTILVDGRARSYILNDEKIHVTKWAGLTEGVRATLVGAFLGVLAWAGLLLRRLRED